MHPFGEASRDESRDRPVVVPAPDDAAEQLRRLILFAELDNATRVALAADAEWLEAPAGSRLFSAGDAPDGLYGILSGRVRFFASVDGRSVLTADASAGITFGEGSVLLGGKRSRTAVVFRDARLVRLPPDRFRSLLTSSPTVAIGVAGLLATRFAVPHDPSVDGAPAVIAVYARSRDDYVDWFVEHLSQALDARVVKQGVSQDGPGRSIIFADPSDPNSDQAVKQADVVLVLRDSERPDPLDGLRGLWAALDPLTAPRVELVLLRHENGANAGTAKWTGAFPQFADVHHVRRGVVGDVKRVGRLLSGTAVGLVLGGGGARGMAHIGVLRAFDELQIPIDRIGGSSMGAVIGAQAALGRPWTRILQDNERAWNRRALHFDLTLPTVSVLSGRRSKRMFDHLLGEGRIEDSLVGFFCTTTNLSRFELAVHRAGPTSRWVRASAGVPGLWPPVVDPAGDLHIDGGQLDNVPTAVMRRIHRGPIIAIDVCATQQPMTVAPGAEPPVGIRHLLRRRSTDRFPSLVDTLNRCTLLSSLQQRAQAAKYADLYLTPDLAAIGFSGFGRIREAADAGYRLALEELAQFS